MKLRNAFALLAVLSLLVCVRSISNIGKLTAQVYVHQDFPQWRFKDGAAPVRVPNQAALDALGPGWVDVPAAAQSSTTSIVEELPGQKTAEVILRPTGPLPAFALELAIPGTLQVYRNGLYLTETSDYTLDGPFVRFVAPDAVPDAGDIVKFRFRRY